MAYLYIHIPQIFPTGFFEESKNRAALISEKIRSRESVMKRCLFLTDTSLYSVISSTEEENQQLLSISSQHYEGACPLIVDGSSEQLPFLEKSRPYDVTLHLYIIQRDQWNRQLFSNLCSFHSLYNTLSDMLFFQTSSGQEKENDNDRGTCL